MPHSYSAGKKEVIEHLKRTIPPDAKVLDVGPGSGGYYNRLKKHFQQMDACEIHQPYIEQFKLTSKYKSVFRQSCVDFQNYSNYDFVIFGDVLEHLSEDDTRKVIDACKNVKQILVAVPFELPQGSSGGVTSECHLQDKLTPESFVQLYPEFEPLCLVKRIFRKRSRKKSQYCYGYYLRKDSIASGDAIVIDLNVKQT